MSEKLKVFISWSGKLSQAVARALHDFLPQVLQNLDPWFSTTDIHGGARWAAEIGDRLESSGVGIFVVTSDNFTRPWLNFEAGAVAKSVKHGKPMPVLFDVKDTEVSGPLTQFQMKPATRQGIWEVIVALNQLLGVDGVRVEQLPKIFDRTWPELEATFKTIRDNEELRPQAEPAPRSVESMFEEIVTGLRTLTQAASAARLSDYRDTLEQVLDSAQDAAARDFWSTTMMTASILSGGVAEQAARRAAGQKSHGAAEEVARAVAKRRVAADDAVAKRAAADDAAIRDAVANAERRTSRDRSARGRGCPLPLRCRDSAARGGSGRISAGESRRGI